MKSSLLTIGVILLVVGLIGTAVRFHVTTMLVVAILGLIGIIWGALIKNKNGGGTMPNSQ